MRRRLLPRAAAPVALAAAALLPLSAAAQHPATRDTGAAPALYAQLAPLQLTLTANIGRLSADRDTNAPWRAGTLGYPTDSGTVTVPARFRTRGVWRLKRCMFPPLRADFREREVRGTPFAGVGRPKLVNFCRDTDAYEQYILQEYQLYRAYALVTPLSFRTRLARITYVDSASRRTHATRYAIIVEDPDEFAKRMNGSVVKTKGARPSDMDAVPLAVAYLFQYMIGNSDFSFNGLHNTQLVGTADGHMIPMVYDFDYTGIVNATYAIPNQALGIAHIRERRFRGRASWRRSTSGCCRTFASAATRSSASGATRWAGWWIRAVRGRRSPISTCSSVRSRPRSRRGARS